MEDFFERVLEKGVSVVLGSIFLLVWCFVNCVWLSFGYLWSDEIEMVIVIFGCCVMDFLKV